MNNGRDAIMRLIDWQQDQPEFYGARAPWDRQPCDSQPIWAAFRTWLALPQPRSAEGLASHLGCTVELAEQWIITGMFAKRAALFDRHLHKVFKEQVTERLVDEAKEYTQRHIELMQQAEELATRELRKALETSLSTPTETLRFRDLQCLINDVIKLSRLLHDQSTENTAHVVKQYDVSKLTPEELRAMRHLTQRAKVKESDT